MPAATPRKKIAVRKPADDDDCTYRPIPIKVDNQTQIALDRYETVMFNSVERTCVCKRLKIMPRMQ